LNQEAFNEQADKILESDFLKYIAARSIPVPNGFVNFGAGSICLSMADYTENCLYYSYDDYLFVRSRYSLNEANFYSLLSAPISLLELNDWQREVVEKNYVPMENIIFENEGKQFRKVKMSIKKENNKVYLKQM